jgi:hypothetical protein
MFQLRTVSRRPTTNSDLKCYRLPKRQLAMTEVPIFAVRLLDDRSCYVIDAVWTDGRTEQIAGVLFKELASAAQWVRKSSGPWV